MPSRLLAVTFDAHDPARVAEFWAGMLRRERVEAAGGVLLPGDDRQVGLRFVASSTTKAGPNGMHLHLTSDSPAHQQDTVAGALARGATHLDVGQRPDEGHIVLADPEGNEFCVIEAGNAYLSGCGFLGEVACDGRRDVGLFWSAALGWPLVWDQDEETAIQSPAGGTKVAWGGPPVAPVELRLRQRFDLVPDEGDQAAEVERLVQLGASRLHTEVDGSVVLADPDGNRLSVLAGDCPLPQQGLTVCPGCGLRLPPEDGPTHRYLTASPACWRSFGELLATFYSDPDRLRFRQLIVDAYAAQHPGEGSRQQVQSVGIHLMTLCLFLEHGVDPSRGSQLHRRMIRRPTFSRIEPRGSTSVTTRHVPVHGPAEVARERAYEWASAVWNLYADDHDTVREWLDESGFSVR